MKIETASLRAHPVGEVVGRIIAAALQAVDPRRLSAAAMAQVEHGGRFVVAGGARPG